MQILIVLAAAALVAHRDAPVFLDEYTTAGAFVQTITMPTTVAGANLRLTASGSATTEGFFSRSQDAQYLVVPGYDAAPAAVGITTSLTVARVMGRVDSSGATARQMGHIPVGGPEGSLRQLAQFPNVKKLFIHINNTNPMLNESGPEYRAVRDAGWEIAEDGWQFTL